MDWLKGKKTYIVAGLYALVALVEFVAKGDFTLTAIVAFFKTESVAAMAATIRAGITKAAPTPK